MSGVVANVWRFFVFVVAGAIVLGMLGINLTPLLASATIIGATLGFGAQQIVRDYFSGILMTMEDQYNVGDSVMVGGRDRGGRGRHHAPDPLPRASTAPSSSSPTATSAWSATCRAGGRAPSST